MIRGFDQSVISNHGEGLVIDCIPIEERANYRLWRAAALAPLVRNVIDDTPILNAGPRNRATTQIHFGLSWRTALAGAVQFASAPSPDFDHQDDFAARQELQDRGFEGFDAPAMIILALDPVLSPETAYNLRKSDNVHRVTEVDVPIAAIDRFTHRNLSQALTYMGLVIPPKAL